MKAALTFLGSAEMGVGGFSEEPHHMATRLGFHLHVLRTTGDQKSLCSAGELDFQVDSLLQETSLAPNT